MKKQYADIIKKAGGEPLDEMDGLIYWNDPLTRSTLTIPVADFSYLTVLEKTARSRHRF